MSSKRIAKVFVEKVEWEIDKLQLALIKEYNKKAENSKDREKIGLVLELLGNLNVRLYDAVMKKEDEFTGAEYYEKAREILDDFGDKYECMTMNQIVLLDVKPEIRRNLHKLFVMDINCVTEEDLRFYN